MNPSWNPKETVGDRNESGKEKSTVVKFGKIPWSITEADKETGSDFLEKKIFSVNPSPEFYLTLQTRSPLLRRLLSLYWCISGDVWRAFPSSLKNHFQNSIHSPTFQCRWSEPCIHLLQTRLPKVTPVNQRSTSNWFRARQQQGLLLVWTGDITSPQSWLPVRF